MIVVLAITLHALSRIMMGEFICSWRILIMVKSHMLFELLYYVWEFDVERKIGT